MLVRLTSKDPSVVLVWSCLQMNIHKSSFHTWRCRSRGSFKHYVDQILPNFDSLPLEWTIVDNCGHFTWHLLPTLGHVTKRYLLLTLSPPPSCCPRSYWMTPSSFWMAGGVESRVSLLYYYISLASVPSAFAAMQCLFFLVSLFGAS